MKNRIRIAVAVLLFSNLSSVRAMRRSGSVIKRSAKFLTPSKRAYSTKSGQWFNLSPRKKALYIGAAAGATGAGLGALKYYKKQPMLEPMIAQQEKLQLQHDEQQIEQQFYNKYELGQQLISAIMNLAIAQRNNNSQEKQKYQDEIYQLLKDGANPNALGFDNKHALEIAVIYNIPSLIEPLILAGANPNARNWMSNEESLFHYALQSKNPQLIKILSQFTHPDMINRTDKFGNTPLYVAIATKNLDMVDALLSAHADPDKPTSYGTTPLRTAIIGLYSLPIIEKLISAGAKVTPQDIRSAKHYKSKYKSGAGVRYYDRLINILENQMLQQQTQEEKERD